MSSIIEKARAGALAGELRGGQSHTVEVVVFIVFAAVIGALLLSGGAAGGNVFFEMQLAHHQEVRKRAHDGDGFHIFQDRFSDDDVVSCCGDRGAMQLHRRRGNRIRQNHAA